MVIPNELLALDSGEPWGIELKIETLGCDFLCRIGGGRQHVGAVALSEWRNGKASTRCLSVEGHREQELATFAAHKLCKAARQSIVCIAGIHFDSIRAEAIEEICTAVSELVDRASKDLENRRFADSLRDCSLLRQLRREAEQTQGSVGRFLSTPCEELVDAERARRVSAPLSPSGDRVLIFAPLYLSSACLNDCVYCGFRRSARTPRTKLSPDLAVREARCLADRGLRTLDLVAGEIPTDAFVDYVCEAIRRILGETAIQRINLNLGALSASQLARLRAAGAVGYHIYQETYDPTLFLDLHPSGPKRDMAYRLEMPRRALAAGFESVGLGILVGLRPLMLELAYLTAHARLLSREFPCGRLGFSLPRVRSAGDGLQFEPAHPASDDDFAKALLFLRREFPDANVTLTTRESPSMRDKLIPLCATKVSAGVSTAPGGYVGGTPEARGQFSICDERSVEEVAQVIRGAGLWPCFA